MDALSFCQSCVFALLNRRSLIWWVLSWLLFDLFAFLSTCNMHAVSQHRCVWILLIILNHFDPFWILLIPLEWWQILSGRLCGHEPLPKLLRWRVEQASLLRRIPQLVWISSSTLWIETRWAFFFRKLSTSLENGLSCLGRLIWLQTRVRDEAVSEGCNLMILFRSPCFFLFPFESNGCVCVCERDSIYPEEMLSTWWVYLLLGGIHQHSVPAEQVCLLVVPVNEWWLLSLQKSQAIQKNKTNFHTLLCYPTILNVSQICLVYLPLEQCTFVNWLQPWGSASFNAAGIEGLDSKQSCSCVATSRTNAFLHSIFWHTCCEEREAAGQVGSRNNMKQPSDCTGLRQFRSYPFVCKLIVACCCTLVGTPWQAS